MAPVIAFMAVKMFWKMHLAKTFLSSSEKPRPWMILICRMKVVFPLSPVPEETTRRYNGYKYIYIKYDSISRAAKRLALVLNVNLPVCWFGPLFKCSTYISFLQSDELKALNCP